MYGESASGGSLDAETNLHYNKFRDFDPTTGRYIESDLIGLAGGLSTYSYTGSNPLTRSDSDGLDWNCSVSGFFVICTHTTPLDPVEPLPPPPQPHLPAWLNQALSPTYDKAGLKVCPTAQTMPPPGDCHPQDQQRMQDTVNNSCKRPRSCKPGMDGVELEIMKENSRECAMARDEINKICFKGGDQGHRDAAIDAWQGVARCEGMMQ